MWLSDICWAICMRLTMIERTNETSKVRMHSDVIEVDFFLFVWIDQTPSLFLGKQIRFMIEWHFLVIMFAIDNIWDTACKNASMKFLWSCSYLYNYVLFISSNVNETLHIYFLDYTRWILFVNVYIHFEYFY